MQPREFRCRAVLLDMDGTLVDSTVPVTAQWRRWSERHGIPYEKVIEISHGRPAFETMTILAPHIATPEELARFLDEEEAHETLSKPIPGALEFVRALPPDRWAVVTSAAGRIARRRIAACGYPTPPVLIAPEDVVRGKPDPLPFLEAARRLGVPARECLVCEDAPAGLKAAAAAGMEAIGIATTYRAEELDVDVVVPDFTGLSAVSNDRGIVVRLRPPAACATIRE
jgi:sugar-phosphatase